MREYLNLGPTPSGEDCQQLGPSFDNRKSIVEMNAFIEQLKRTFPNWQESGIVFGKKSFPHDFGSYSEVCVFFDDGDEVAANAAYDVESNTPEYWDEPAKQYLTERSYF